MKTLKTEHGIKIDVRSIEESTDNAEIVELSYDYYSSGDYVEGFQVDMIIDATLADGTSEKFTIACQSADISTEKLRAHSTTEMRFAQNYGADWDESWELEKFVDYEDWDEIAEFLIDLAEDMCQEWYDDNKDESLNKPLGKKSKKESRTKASMQKKLESLRRGKKNETSTSEGARFFDSFIRDRATDILDEYSVNEACSSGCEAWAEIGNGVEDTERSSSDSVGELVKAWTTNLWGLNSWGNLDPKTAAEYDRIYDVAVSDYHSEYGDTAPEDTDEFYEYIDAYMAEGTDIFAEASVLLYRGRYGYELTGHISRSFDYVYGSSASFKDDMSLQMVLTDEQLTEENAEAFLEEFESRVAEYQFSDGIKEYTLTAK